jgi:pimeloyl-ACP methyl ester carboxylesterase
MRADTILVGGTSLFIRQWGTADDATLFFWHGRGGTGLCLNEVGPLLASHYQLHIVALDAPGLGRSPALPAPQYQLPLLADLAAGAMTTLGIERAVFMGHSWGGAVGCYFAARHPSRTRALVLIDGGYQDSSELSEEQLEDRIAETVTFYQSFRFPSWEAYLAEEQRHVRRWTPAMAEAFLTTMREQQGEVVPVITADLIAAIERGSHAAPVAGAYDALRHSGVPVLLLVATEPAARQAARHRLTARFQQHVPQAVICPMPGCGHDVIADAGPDLARIVGDWLTSTLPAIRGVAFHERDTHFRPDRSSPAERPGMA